MWGCEELVGSERWEGRGASRAGGVGRRRGVGWRWWGQASHLRRMRCGWVWKWWSKGGVGGRFC